MALSKRRNSRNHRQHERHGGRRPDRGAMEEKFGVSAAAAPVAAAPAGRLPTAARPAAEEQTEFDVVMTSFGDNKVRHQGGARHHRSGPEGSQGPGRRRARPPSRKACPRTKPKTSRSSSKKPARASRSSKHRNCLTARAWTQAGAESHRPVRCAAAHRCRSAPARHRRRTASAAVADRRAHD